MIGSAIAAPSTKPCITAVSKVVINAACVSNLWAILMVCLLSIRRRRLLCRPILHRKTIDAPGSLGRPALKITGVQVTRPRGVEARGSAAVPTAIIEGTSFSNVSLFLDTDLQGIASFQEIVGAPEPGTAGMLAGGLFLLLLTAWPGPRPRA